MRVLIFSIYHDPEPIPKTGELARELHRRGHEVTVVTAFPHYPSGRLYDGYRLRLWQWETRDSVRVLRTFIYPYHGTSTILRVLNYVTWMLSSIQAAWLCPPCDVAYVWHPPLTVGVSAWIVSKLKRVRFVYDVQDLWPESALASGLMRPGMLVDVLHRLADWVYARAHRILVVSEAAAAVLRKRGVPASKVAVAPHWIDPSTFEAASGRDVRAEYGWNGRFVVMFAGNLGMVQGLETVIDAAALMPAGSNVEFVFVGDGSDRVRLERLARERGLSRVRFLGRHPPADMPAFLQSADALLVHLRNSDIAEHAIPTKILSYLAAARPIVCAMRGPAAELVDAADAGLTTAPGDAPALASAIQGLQSMPSEERDRMGRRGRDYVRTHLDRSRVIDLYEDELAAVAGVQPRRPEVPGRC